MSDLISRSDLYDQLANKLTWLMGYGDDVYLAVGSDIRDVIYNMPTAYDIDKVVEELEIKENEAVLKAPNTSDLQNPDYQKWMMKSYGLKEAIEIVKQGVVRNEV